MYEDFLETILVYIKALNTAEKKLEEGDHDPDLSPYLGRIEVMFEDEGAYMRTSSNLAFMSTQPARGGGDQRRPREHRTASSLSRVRVSLAVAGGRVLHSRPLTCAYADFGGVESRGEIAIPERGLSGRSRGLVRGHDGRFSK